MASPPPGQNIDGPNLIQVMAWQSQLLRSQECHGHAKARAQRSTALLTFPCPYILSDASIEFPGPWKE